MASCVFDAHLDVTDFTNLRDWHARIRQRPAVQAVLAAEHLPLRRAA